MKLPQKEVECKIQTSPPSAQEADAPERPEENADILIKNLLLAFRKLCMLNFMFFPDLYLHAIFILIGVQVKLLASFVMVDLGGYQLLDRLIQWSVRNPHKAICILAAFLAFLLPFLLMLGIGLSTLLMTLTGFLILEGI